MRYRVEWMHNGNWRMELNDGMVYKNEWEAVEKLNEMQAEYPDMKLRVIEVRP